MFHYLVAALFFLTLPAQTQSTAITSDDEISAEAKTFIVDLNLGDYDKMQAVARPEDAQFLSGANLHQAAALMKIKELPELAEIRSQLARLAIATLTFSKPEFAPDGTSATVTLTMLPAEARTFVKEKAVYINLLRATYRAQVAGTAVPTLQDIQARFDDPSAPIQKEIDQKTEALLKATPPSMHFEKTTLGWRIDVTEFLHNKS